jgi:hypothetical protein
MHSGSRSRGGQCRRARKKTGKAAAARGARLHGDREHLDAACLRFARFSRPSGRPHAGAWIETTQVQAALESLRSPLMRGRGSKPLCGYHGARDLRRPSCGGVDRNNVTGVSATRVGSRPSCRGRGSKHNRHDHREPKHGSPLMRGRGSKHSICQLAMSVSSRPSCGGVDRNYA